MSESAHCGDQQINADRITFIYIVYTQIYLPYYMLLIYIIPPWIKLTQKTQSTANYLWQVLLIQYRSI